MSDESLTSKSLYVDCSDYINLTEIFQATTGLIICCGWITHKHNHAIYLGLHLGETASALFTPSQIAWKAKVILCKSCASRNKYRINSQPPSQVLDCKASETLDYNGANGNTVGCKVHETYAGEILQTTSHLILKYLSPVIASGTICLNLPQLFEPAWMLCPPLWCHSTPHMK